QDLWNAHCRRRLENAIRGAGNAFFGSMDPDERLGLVVIRRHVGVANGPIDTETIARIGREVVLRESQRGPPVMVRSATKEAAEKPADLAAGRHGIRLGLILPEAILYLKKIALLFAEVKGRSLAGAAMRKISRHLVLAKVLLGMQHWPGLDQRH